MHRNFTEALTEIGFDEEVRGRQNSSQTIEIVKALHDVEPFTPSFFERYDLLGQHWAKS
jgi:hypothetical protein